MKTISARVRAGISLVKYKPVFSPDSKYLFVVAGTGVKVFVTITSECLHNLYADHGEVVACFINPKNKLQLITVSRDGYICFWNYEDAVLVGECHVKGEVLASYPHNNLNALYVVKLSKNGQEHELVLVQLNRNKSIESDEKILPLNLRIKSPALVDYSGNFDRLALVKKHDLIVYEIATGQRTKLRAGKIAYTCVIWHPSEECVATGSEIGIIYLWTKKVAGSYDASDWTRQQMHWHPATVADISFSGLGSYFYSIGQEGVLVKWKTDSKDHQFLPRLGMPLCRVACAPLNDYVAVSHVDNSIDIVLVSTNNVENVIQGLVSCHHWEETSTELVPTGLLHDPRTGCLVLNGRTGHLQFYNLFDDRNLFSLDITLTNYVSSKYKSQREIYHLRVTKAAFDGRGDWLATVEYWSDGVLSPIVRLKFWRYLAEKQTYTLNTTVETPHSSEVNTLQFQPLTTSLDYDQIAPTVVTTGNDKRIRFWNLQEEEISHNVQQQVWTCGGSGTYRDLTPGDASFSEDGTILAVAFADSLTLWDSRTKELRSNLCHSRIDKDIKQVVFGRHECSHLLVCTTESSLIVWDTLSLSVLWCVQNTVVCLVGDLATDNMAAFTASGELFVFKPTDALPLAIHANVCQKRVMFATFIPQRKRKADGSYVPWLQRSELIYMDSDQKLYTLSSDQEEVETASERVVLQRHIPLTPFGLLLAEQRKSGVEMVEQTFHDMDGCAHKKIIKEILNTPAQVLPAPADLCRTYLNSLLKPLKDRTIDKNGVDDSDDDSGLETQSGNDDSDSDADAEPSVAAPATAIEDYAGKSNEIVSVSDLDGVLRRAAAEDYKWLVASSN